MACGDLTQSELFACTDPLQAGVGNESLLTLILRQDIASFTLSPTVPNLITGITLVSGKTAYGFEGFRQSLKPKYQKVDGPSGQTMYQHMADFFVYGYSQRTKNNLQRLGNGLYVGIFSNAKQDANAFEVMGIGCGMQVQTIQRGPSEDGGAFKISMQTPADSPEALMPQTLLATDYAGTLTLINTLMALPGITTLSVTVVAVAGGTAITVTGSNFFGGGPNNAVLSLQWINQGNGNVVNQPTFTVASNTSITLTTVALVAGIYKLRITTTKGVIESAQNVTAQ